MSALSAPATCLLCLPDPVHPERPYCRCEPTYRSPASELLGLPDPMAVDAPLPVPHAAHATHAAAARASRRVARRIVRRTAR